MSSADSIQEKVEEVRKQLGQLDYRLTSQREAILVHFLQAPNEHFSADDVYMETKKEHPEIGLATVYRTLELFEKLGILHKLNYGDGQSHYEFTETEGHYHHHLICLGCGKILHHNEDLLEEVEKKIANERHFRIVDHSLRFFGYCEECEAGRS